MVLKRGLQARYLVSPPPRTFLKGNTYAARGFLKFELSGTRSGKCPSETRERPLKVPRL